MSMIELGEACNLRDLGGLQTDDGQVTRHGMIFRSASLYNLSESHLAMLGRLGIVQVVDLRSNTERAAQPTSLVMNTWFRAYEGSNGELMRAFGQRDLTPARAVDLMIEVYRTLPEEQADSYKELLRRIADAKLPVLFHCSAGKDRTGIAAAVLLELLGVPRAAILRDYLRTNATISHSVANVKSALQKLGMPTLDDSVLAPVLGVKSLYLKAMYLALEEKYGSVLRYAEERLGASTSVVSAIRGNLLGPVGAEVADKP